MTHVSPDLPDDANSALVDLLVETSFAIVAVVTRVGAEHDLSLTLVRMLGILRDRTLRMAELADYLGLERSTVSGLIDRAERLGLVLRRSHSRDARATEVLLTEQGHELARVATGEVAARIAPIVAGLPIQAQGSLG
jgi:DNA-binding MarR family transcriptional regulator